MKTCPHCDGTGIAPDRLTLECIGCQRAVTVTFSSTADLMTKCENVLCSDCRKMRRTTPADQVKDGKGGVA